MTFRTSLPLPRRLRFGPGPSLRIRLNRKALAGGTGAEAPKRSGFTLHRLSADTLLVRWYGIGDFAIEHGREIRAHVRDGAPWGEFRDLLLTNILAFALLEQGVETLHASAIERGGKAVAFAGRAGSAKSTLAALFARRGCRVLTDDLLPLHLVGKDVRAYPSLGEIKLMPEAARALRIHRRHLRSVSPRLRKRIWRVRPVPGPRPLAAVYFPSISARGRRVVLRPLSYRETFRNLLTHNFNAVLITRRRQRKLFALCTEIAKRVSARRLIIPRGWKNLEEAARRIEADLERIRG